jgi:hypothetical protein
MRKMSYLLLCAAIGFITGCSDNDSQQPVKKNELGLIVPQFNAAANALLLTDGTLANPVSGIPNFNSRAAGGKLLIDYRKLSVENGITNIAVTHFAEANDSTFTVEPDTTATTTPTSLYATTFSGTYFVIDEDSVTTFRGEVSFTFGAEQSGPSTYTYTFIPDSGSPISGAGEFIWYGETIEFLNNEDEAPIVPLGEFQVYLNASHPLVYLWHWDNAEKRSFLSFALTKD